MQKTGPIAFKIIRCVYVFDTANNSNFTWDRLQSSKITTQKLNSCKDYSNIYTIHTAHTIKILSTVWIVQGIHYIGVTVTYSIPFWLNQIDITMTGWPEISYEFFRVDVVVLQIATFLWGLLNYKLSWLNSQTNKNISFNQHTWFLKRLKSIWSDINWSIKQLGIESQLLYCYLTGTHGTLYSIRHPSCRI